MMKWSAIAVAFFMALIKCLWWEIWNIKTIHRRFYAWCEKNDERWDGYIKRMHDWTNK